MNVCNRVGGICRGLLDFCCCLRSKFISSKAINFSVNDLCQGFISGALANVPLSDKMGLGKVRDSFFFFMVKIF
jgi:hypothetical protein